MANIKQHGCLIGILLLAVVCFFWSTAGIAQEGGVCSAEQQAQANKLCQQAQGIFAERLSQKVFIRAIAQMQNATRLCPQFEEGWILLSHLCWDLGDQLPRDNKAIRISWFQKGEAAADKALALHADTAGGLYWKTANMAGTADMKGWSSNLWVFKTLLKNMDRVDKLEPHYYYGATSRFWSEVLTRVPLFLADRFGFDVEEVEREIDAEIKHEPRFFANYTFAARLLWKMEKKDKALGYLRYVLSGDAGALASDKGDNLRQQDIARKMWWEYTGQEFSAN